MAADGMQGLTSWTPQTSPTTDASGHAIIDPAPAGSVSVTCLVPSSGLSNPSTDLKLAAGARASVELLSAALGGGWPATIGIEMDWRVTTPRISVVQPDGPAATVGVLVGDVIVAVDGMSVTGLNGPGVINVLDNRTPGSDVAVTVLRRSSKTTFNITTASRQYQ